MIRRIFFISLFLHFYGLSIGQVPDTTRTIEILLPQSNFIKAIERISLFESDSFIIYTSFDILVKNFKNFIKENAVKEDLEILRILVDNSKPLSTNLKEIQNDQEMKSRLDYRTADLLLKRKCGINLIFDQIDCSVSAYHTKNCKRIKFSSISRF